MIDHKIELIHWTALQYRIAHLESVERDLDLSLRQPAGIMDLLQAVQPAEGQPEAAAPPQESWKYFKDMLHPDSQLWACKEKDIVMHSVNMMNKHEKRCSWWSQMNKHEKPTHASDEQAWENIDCSAERQAILSNQRGLFQVTCLSLKTLNLL